MQKVVIIGAGPGGIAACLWCHRLGIPALVLEKAARIGGQLEHIQNEIIDYLGFPAGTGGKLIDQFERHLTELNVLFQEGPVSLEENSSKTMICMGQQVSSIDFEERVLLTNEGHSIQFDYMIAATGAAERRLGVPGEDQAFRSGKSRSISSNKDRYRNRPVTVVGGGDRAAEGALLLADAGADVTLVHRSDQFRARAEYMDRLIRHPRIEILTNSYVEKIIVGEEQDQVKGLEVKAASKASRFIQADAVFIRIGVHPNSELFAGKLKLDSEGYIEVSNSVETSNPYCLAVGDVVNSPLYSSISHAVGQGMVAAKTIEYRLRKKEQK